MIKPAFLPLSPTLAIAPPRNLNEQALNSSNLPLNQLLGGVALLSMLAIVGIVTLTLLQKQRREQPVRTPQSYEDGSSAR